MRRAQLILLAICLALIGAIPDRARGEGPSIRLRAVLPSRSGPLAREGHSGLGLRISGGLVEAQGGELTLTSREGAGATVTIMLPIRPMDKRS